MPDKITTSGLGKSESDALRATDSSVIRQSDHLELPQPVPGLFEGYVTMVAGAGGVGKTFWAEQVIRHLASGVQLGRFPLPDEPQPVLALFLEDVEALTQSRSFEVAPFGTLEEDNYAPGSGHDTVAYDLHTRSVTGLRHQLELLQAAGRPKPEFIVIDYFHLFIGDQPSGASPVEWERRKITEIRQLAVDYGLHILLLTHLNKKGDVNGTAAIRNAVDTLYVIEPSDDRNYATLKCEKMRMGPPIDYAMSRKANGTWGFDDQVYVSETMIEGTGKDILTVLRKEGPQTLSRLCMHHEVSGSRDAIRQALTRMRKKEFVTNRRGHWEATMQPGDKLIRPLVCSICHTRMSWDDGSGMHITCAPAPAPAPLRTTIPQQRPASPPQTVVTLAPQPEPVKETAPEPEAIIEGEQEGNSYFEDSSEEGKDPRRGGWGLKSLKDSISKSRYNPLPRVPKENRDQEPWTLMKPKMAGKPKWTRTEPHPEGGKLVILDRNGSFPSACSSVVVAPNKLVHTGALNGDTRRAGIFLINVPEWDETNMPHPLGSMARRMRAVGTSAQTWVTTPHLRLLHRLYEANRIPEFTIHDSWTGVGNASLFERFYEDVKLARAELLDDPDAYVAMKKSVVQAIGMLNPSRPEVRSPFFRPDWQLSIAAESSVRHWLKADQAVQNGALLVSMGSTDEVVFWTPDGAVPAPYEEGKKFGQVKVKTATDDASKDE